MVQQRRLPKSQKKKKLQTSWNRSQILSFPTGNSSRLWRVLCADSNRTSPMPCCGWMTVNWNERGSESEREREKKKDKEEPWERREKKGVSYMHADCIWGLKMNFYSILKIPILSFLFVTSPNQLSTDSFWRAGRNGANHFAKLFPELKRTLLPL